MSTGMISTFTCANDLRIAWRDASMPFELESPVPLEPAAVVIAGEQSSGTFMRLPGDD